MLAYFDRRSFEIVVHLHLYTANLSFDVVEDYFSDFYLRKFVLDFVLHARQDGDRGFGLRFRRLCFLCDESLELLNFVFCRSFGVSQVTRHLVLHHHDLLVVSGDERQNLLCKALQEAPNVPEIVDLHKLLLFEDLDCLHQ